MTFKTWIKGAAAAFCDGFIEGLPVGSPVGGGIAAADGAMHADFGKRHIAVELAHVLAVPFFTGLSDLRSYQKSNPLTSLISNAPTPPSLPSS